MRSAHASVSQATTAHYLHRTWGGVSSSPVTFPLLRIDGCCIDSNGISLAVKSIRTPDNHGRVSHQQRIVNAASVCLLSAVFPCGGRYCSDRAELANLYVHLTNVAIQKKAGDYDKDVGCKWDLLSLKVRKSRRLLSDIVFGHAAGAFYCTCKKIGYLYGC